MDRSNKKWLTTKHVRKRDDTACCTQYFNKLFPFETLLICSGRIFRCTYPALNPKKTFVICLTVTFGPKVTAWLPVVYTCNARFYFLTSVQSESHLDQVIFFQFFLLLQLCRVRPAGGVHGIALRLGDHSSHSLVVLVTGVVQLAGLLQVHLAFVLGETERLDSLVQPRNNSCTNILSSHYIALDDSTSLFILHTWLQLYINVTYWTPIYSDLVLNHLCVNDGGNRGHVRSWWR